MQTTPSRLFHLPVSARSVVVLLICLWGAGAGAADTPVTFTDPAQQSRYNALLEQLRCLVCQNQSLADSHADLAQDLRDEVERMVKEGQDDAAVLEFMVARYGDFVLYRPPVKAQTLSLWLGPPALLALVAVVWRRTQRRAPQETPVPLSETERARLTALLPPRDPS